MEQQTLISANLKHPTILVTETLALPGLSRQWGMTDSFIHSLPWPQIASSWGTQQMATVRGSLTPLCHSPSAFTGTFQSR